MKFEYLIHVVLFGNRNSYFEVNVFIRRYQYSLTELPVVVQHSATRIAREQRRPARQIQKIFDIFRIAFNYFEFNNYTFKQFAKKKNKNKNTRAENKYFDTFEKQEVTQWLFY